MNGRILVVCASRGRPESFSKMVQSVANTSRLVDVALYLDEDDPKLSEYSGQDVLEVGPRIGVCRSANQVIKNNPGYSMYGWVVDDCEVIVPDWDRWSLECVSDFVGGIGAISPQTAHGADKRMDFPFLTGKWVESWGSFVPYEVEHFYWDIALQIVAEDIGIRFAKDEFVIVHEGIMPAQEKPKAETVTDYGRRVLNSHVDARTTCRWLALERQNMVRELNKARYV